MSGILTAREVSVSFGAVQVLDAVSLAVGPGDRVGVVAPNGVGKSTLLRVLAGELEPESGTVIAAPRTATVIHLLQEPDIRAGETLYDHLARRVGVTSAQSILDSATEALSRGESGAEYSDALERWLALGGADLSVRAATVTAELGLPDDLLRRGAAHLSGGQKARLSLAAVLLSSADILLLDEPTNDLDNAGLAGLEQFLLGYRGGLVVVSHDRAFLERIVNRVLEIDEFTRQAVEYSGGWESYVEEREAGRRQARIAYEQNASERARLTEAARRTREWARAGAQRDSNPNRVDDGDKNIRHRRIQRAQKVGSGAARLERALDRMDTVEEPREPWELRLSIGETQRAGQIVAELRHAVIERGDVRLGPIDLTIAWADRVRIIGPNGSGKSTLIEALLGRLAPMSGDAYLGPGVVVGEIDQSRRLFATDTPLLDVVQEATGAEPVDCRTLLAKFRIGADAVTRPANTLSPGERTRAGLALLQARGVNFLVLDEPTNHLDLPAIEQLEQAIGSFGGTLVLVTHDRRLADAVDVDTTIDVTELQSLTES